MITALLAAEGVAKLGAAVGAGVLVDLVVIGALENGVGRAVLGAGAAGNALVGDNVHSMYLL